MYTFIPTDADTFKILLANIHISVTVYIDNIRLIIRSNTYPITDNF